MGCLVNGTEIILSGDVGATGFWFDDAGFGSSDVILALAQAGDANDITIRLNSGGGVAWEGSAIHSAIARHTGKVTVVIEGVAASAASVIAMAGDEVVMSLGAIMMVHDPSGITMGTIEDHQDQINCLTTLADAMATIYAAKTGLSQPDCRADMAAETWMTADQAVAKGYADRALGNDGDEQGDQPVEPAPHAYAAYRHAPEPIMALAKAKRWTGAPRAAVAPKPKPKSKPKAEEAAPMPTEAEIQARIDAAVKQDREDRDAEAEAAAAGTGSADPAAGAAVAVVLSPANAADIAELCASSGVPTMAAPLIREGVTLEVAKARVDGAGKIKNVVALARRLAPSLPTAYADEAIAGGKTVDAVKAELFDRMAGADEQAPIDTMHRAGAGGANHGAPVAAEVRAKSKASMAKELERQGLKPKKGA